MIGSYSPLIRLADKKSIKKHDRNLVALQKNVIKCNRSGKLSYCKDNRR